MRLRLHHILLPALAMIFLFPFFFLGFLSLSARWRFPDLQPGYFGWQNWIDVFTIQTGLLSSLSLSLLISLTVAVVSTGLGFVVSKQIAYHPRKPLFTLLTYFPYILSPVVFGACLLFIFMVLGLFGNAVGVVLAQFIVAFPYSLIFFGSFWGKKTQALEELVATLGGNNVQAFYKVLLPMAKGMLLVCFFQTFLISWFEYGLTSVIGGGKVQTLPVKVFFYVKEANFYYGALSGCLLMLPPVLLLWLNKRYIFNKVL